MMQAIKYGPFIPYEYSATDFAFQTLRALVSATIPDYVSVIYSAIARTVSIPTKEPAKAIRSVFIAFPD
jgi:hypothetical protein